jgi:hypothetical protein
MGFLVGRGAAAYVPAERVPIEETREMVAGQSLLATINLPPAPVLIVSAGILPTSPLSFLDRFDEGVERTIFTFGVRRLRAESALRHASERVAELQMLDAYGVRTKELTAQLVAEHGDLLEFAARSVGEEFARGGRPVVLMAHVVRTTLASVDALERLFETGEDLALLGLREGDVLGTEQRSWGRRPDDVLGVMEDRVDVALFPNTAVVPDQILRLVATEKFAAARRDLERAGSSMAPTSQGGLVLVGAEELTTSAHAALQQASALFLGGQYAEALSFTRDARMITRWLGSGRLAVSTKELLDDPEAARTRIDQLLGDLTRHGLLTIEETRSARARAQAALRAAL